MIVLYLTYSVNFPFIKESQNNKVFMLPTETN